MEALPSIGQPELMRAATTEDLGAAVRAERTRRGMTQTELASLSGTTRQWISAFERGRTRVETDLAFGTLGAIGLSVDLSPDPPEPAHGMLTTVEAARRIRRELDNGDTEFALRLLARTVADIRSIAEPTERAAAMSAPPSTGDFRWDTLIAATIEREARMTGAPPPEWTESPPLGDSWFPDPDPLLADRHIAATPPELAHRNIFFDRRSLESL